MREERIGLSQRERDRLPKTDALLLFGRGGLRPPGSTYLPSDGRHFAGKAGNGDYGDPSVPLRMTEWVLARNGGTVGVDGRLHGEILRGVYRQLLRCAQSDLKGSESAQDDNWRGIDLGRSAPAL